MVTGVCTYSILFSSSLYYKQHVIYMSYIFLGLLFYSSTSAALKAQDQESLNISPEV
jgi:hypothetical protein